MFFLGIVVGRGTAPVRFDMQKIEKELAQLRQAFRKAEEKRYRSHLAKGDTEREFEFYEKLLKSEEDTDIPKIETFRPKKPGKKRIKTKPPAKKDAVEAPVTPQFTIQVASSPDEKDADRLVDQLKKKGFPAYRTARDLPNKGTWHRVRIGKFTKRKDAEMMLVKIRQHRASALIIEIGP
jgi:septal ring-binding cell division protein DamX